MHKISTLNKIAPAGIDRFSADYSVSDGSAGIAGSEAVIVRSMDMHQMDFGDQLIAIARAGAGVNNIPLDKCKNEGIAVFNAPGANANAVKELVIGSLCITARHLDSAVAWTRTLADMEDPGPAIEAGKGQFVGYEIMGKTLGIVGLGNTGARIAKAALDLGLHVIGFDPYLSVHAALFLDPRVQVVESLDELLPLCDFVTLHIPATGSTKEMVNADLLSKFKDGAVLLNFSRDKLVVEKDIVTALESGKLSKYVTDFAMPSLMGRKDTVVTPHIGASTKESEDNCAMMAANEIIDYLENGNIVNSVIYPRVTLGTKAAGHTRLSVCTKGVEDPMAAALAIAGSAKITASKAAVRQDVGYALLDIEGACTPGALPAGVTRCRVIE